MTTTTFDPSEGASEDQMAREADALAQGEKLVQAAEEDRLRQFEQIEAEGEDVSLIGGKFKSQEDLLKAYEELQKKLGNNTPEEEEEPSEEQPEASEEVPEEEAPEEVEVTETVNYMNELSREYEEKGELSEEAIERLSSLDPKDLIKSYLAYQQQATQAQLQQSEVSAIMDSVGGADAYGEITSWAASNLPAEEVAQFNAVTNSGNAAAIRFAVEALNNRYRQAEGYEAPLVTGRKAAPKAKGYRSQAELARDIADPRYSSDPAFRMDVEEKLARSGNLL
jgi:hypothetical protein